MAANANSLYAVKLHFENDIRRFRMPQESYWGALQDKVFDIYGLTAESYKVKYADEDGDKVLISNTDDLVEAHGRLAEGRAVLKLFIERVTAPPVDLPAPPSPIVEVLESATEPLSSAVEFAAPVATECPVEEVVAVDEAATVDEEPAGDAEQKQASLRKKTALRRERRELKRELRELRREEKHRLKHTRHAEHVLAKQARGDSSQAAGEEGPLQAAGVSDGDREAQQTEASSGTECTCTHCPCARGCLDVDRLAASLAASLAVHQAPSLRKPEPNSRDMEVLHPHVACDQCDQPVVGPRYKCAMCDNYDLCAACEALGDHDPTHILLKLRRPLGVAVYLDVDQHLLRQVDGRATCCDYPVATSQAPASSSGPVPDPIPEPPVEEDASYAPAAVPEKKIEMPAPQAEEAPHVAMVEQEAEDAGVVLESEPAGALDTDDMEDFVVVDEVVEEVMEEVAKASPSEVPTEAAAAPSDAMPSTITYPAFDMPAEAAPSAPAEEEISYPTFNEDPDQAKATVEEPGNPVATEVPGDMMAVQDEEKKRLKAVLMSLGFEDEQHIDRCLEECGGDLETIVVRLLGEE